MEVPRCLQGWRGRSSLSFALSFALSLSLYASTEALVLLLGCLLQSALAGLEATCSGAAVGLDLSQAAPTALLAAWLDCAMHRDCLAPAGAHRGNHHQEQVGTAATSSNDPSPIANKVTCVCARICPPMSLATDDVRVGFVNRFACRLCA